MRVWLKELLIGGAALLAATSFSFSEPRGNHYVILLDASQSNPMVHSADHAARVADDVLGLIGGFRMADRITVSTLGEWSTERNAIREAMVDRRFPPERAAPALRALIAGFPEAVKTDLGGAQGATNILGSLDAARTRIACAQHKTYVIVLSDGQETALNIDASTGSFEGCTSFDMIGVMAPTPEATAQLRGAWEAWCKRAGFATCRVTN